MSYHPPFPAVKKVAALTALILLTGCTVGPNYSRPEVTLPTGYSEGVQAEGSATELQHDWWRLYNDTALNQLVESALLNNRDLQKAVAQIDQAAAILDTTSANILPQVNLEGSSGRSRSSTLNAQPLPPGTPVISSSNRLALSTSFEIDFWGKLRRASEAARAQLLGSRYAHDVVALTLAATTSQAYFTLRSLDARIDTTRQTVALRDEGLSVINSRLKGGLASELDLNQAQLSRSDAALQLHELQRQRRLVENQLALITANLGFKVAALPQTALPSAIQPPVGLPSTLLERRPDVQQAEQALMAANARIGVTKAAQLPTFSLTGILGGQSVELGDLLNSGARIWSLGLGATLPVIDAGKYAARTREAEALQQQAQADYQKAVETAFKEVADALANVEQSNASVADLHIRVDAARNALRLSQMRYDAGYSGYLEVLEAQRSSNSAEQSLILNRQAQLLYNIDLMKALGGGWSREGITAPTREKAATPEIPTDPAPESSTAHGT